MKWDLVGSAYRLVIEHVYVWVKVDMPNLPKIVWTIIGQLSYPT